MMGLDPHQQAAVRKTVKLIIFDLSGVCFNVEEEPFARRFAAEHNLDADAFAEAYNTLIKKAELDEMSGEDVWRQLLEQFHMRADIRKTITAMLDEKQAYPEMLGLVRQLRKSCKTAYFTNYNRAYWDYLSKRFDLTPYFDFGIVSYQIRSRKPDPEGFKAILDHFRVRPGEAVFTDDSEKNLANAAQLGIHTIHFKGKEQLIAELRKLGIAVPSGG